MRQVFTIVQKTKLTTPIVVRRARTLLQGRDFGVDNFPFEGK